MRVPEGPATGPPSIGLLVDASYRAEGSPGLTDLKPRSGGEGEVGALRIGTYWFATRVNEITSPTRPASPGTTSTVEACHPLVTGRRRPAGRSVDPSLCSVVVFSCGGTFTANDAGPRRIPVRRPTSLATARPAGDTILVTERNRPATGRRPADTTVHLNGHSMANVSQRVRAVCQAVSPTANNARKPRDRPGACSP